MSICEVNSAQINNFNYFQSISSAERENWWEKLRVKEAAQNDAVKSMRQSLGVEIKGSFFKLEDNSETKKRMLFSLTQKIFSVTICC